MKTVGLVALIVVVTIVNVTLFLIARSLWSEAHGIELLRTEHQTAAPDMPASSQHISYISPDGTGWRESIRIWGQFIGKDHIYYGILLDNSRWLLTNAGSISCDAPVSSAGWNTLSGQEQAEIVDACRQQWTRWAWAYPEHYDIDYGAARSWGPDKQRQSLLVVWCNEMSGPVWDSLADEKQNKIKNYCATPERIWRPL